MYLNGRSVGGFVVCCTLVGMCGGGTGWMMCFHNFFHEVGTTEPPAVIQQQPHREPFIIGCILLCFGYI